MPFCHEPPEPTTCPLCERAGRDTAFAAALAKVPAPKRAPAPRGVCGHLGGPTGESVQCKSCRGHVELKLLACTLHGSCTTHKQINGVACCRGCGDDTTRRAALPFVRVPAPPPLELTPRSARAVVTVVAGEEAEALHEVSGPAQRAYAERQGADYVVCRWPGHPNWPMSAKYAAAAALAHYDRVAYLDADVLPRPGCVDLFVLCGADEFGAVDELPHSRVYPQYGQEKRYRAFRRRMGFADVAHPPFYLNAGVWVASRFHARLLAPPTRPVPADHCAEQDYLNARLLDEYLAGRVRVRLLDRRANWQSWCDCDGGLFASAPPDAILHFSGGGELRKRRVQDMRTWASSNVRPVLPQHDNANGATADAVFDRNGFLGDTAGQIFGANGGDLRVSEFTTTMPFANLCCAVSPSVGVIVGVSSPVQIAQGVVGVVSVSMTGFHPLCAGTDERFQDQLVDSANSSAGAKCDSQIPLGTGRPESQLSPSVAYASFPIEETTPHAAVVADAVAGESFDGLVGDGRIVDSHDVPSLTGCYVVRAAVVSQHHCPPDLLYAKQANHYQGNQ